MKQREETSNKIGVFRRIMLPFVLTAVLDCVLLLVLLWAGGLFDSMRKSGLDILGETTLNQHRLLEQAMLSWADLDELGESACIMMEQTLAERGKTPGDIRSDPELANALVASCKDLLLDTIRIHTTDGVFIVLDGPGVAGKPDTFAGMYLCDASPQSSQAGNEDLSLMRGLPPLARGLDITLNSFWEASFTLPGGAEDPANAFYYRPLNAYRERKNARTPAKYYEYWCTDFCINPAGGKRAVSCTRPLVGADGTVYGVYGVAAELDSLQGVFASTAANGSDKGESFYIGVTMDGGSSYRCVTALGQGFVQHFSAEETLTPLRTVSYNNTDYIQVQGGRTGLDFYGAVYPLNLYRTNTPFRGEGWALVGLRATEDMFALENRFRNSVIVVTVIGLVLGLLIAFWAADSISHPITRLVEELRSPNRAPFEPLNDTGIREVDELADTITKLNLDAMEEAARFSKIIAMAGLPVGTFERRKDLKAVYCSDSFFAIMDCQALHNDQNRIADDVFERLIQDKLTPVSGFGEGACLVQGVSPEKYVRLRILERNDSVVGTLMDVTAEILKQKRIEHERDHDMLTNLLNRRAFEARVNQLFTGEPERLDKVSAMLMLDLDNLKTVNDTYGHDSGDQYIHDFASALECLRDERCLIGRRSGDEFFIFYYGYPSKDALRKVIRAGWRAMQHRYATFSDGTKLRLRASGGMAWYPDQADAYARLLHYADFAMYRVKNALKGSIKEFNQAEYKDEGYRLDGIQALNQLLEQQLVRYAFQPIVSAQTGAVYGYEMLMRPLVKELFTPTLVLNLAREQGMLKQLEGMTWKAVIAAVGNLRAQGRLDNRAKLFINSIPNQILSPEDEEQVRRGSIGLFPSVIMEISEEENPDDGMTLKKLEIFQAMGAEIALEAGMGTALEAAGAYLENDKRRMANGLHYLKLGKNMTRGVEREPEKRLLMESVIQRAHSLGVQVIAMGVETKEELYALVALGTDYLQGFYLAYPDLEPMGIAPEIAGEIKAAAQGRWGTGDGETGGR